MKMFYLGFGMYVRKDLIIGIGEYALGENKRKCKEAKERYMLSDYSSGKVKESVVFTSDGMIYISAIPTENLVKSFEEE